MRRFSLILAPLLLAAGLPAQAAGDDLDARVRAQITGDRSGACVAVALIDGGQVQRSFQCARPEDVVRISGARAFEIGSISKTMTATLLATLIAEGRGSLDDPLADWLPAGTVVPDWQGQPIRLRHVLTHTSGLPALPAAMEGGDPHNPYAHLTPQAVLDALRDVRLEAAPGSRHAYSNFASMLLSLAVVQRAGKDLPTLLRERLFAPLGMDTAHVGPAPAGITPVQPRTAGGQPTPAWDIPADLAGVGGVRASLEDMVAWARAQLGQAPASLQPALALVRQPLLRQPPMGMNWFLAPLDGRALLVHEGATGGSASYIAVDRERQRAVVVLSDTSWSAAGGLHRIGEHLLDGRLPGFTPRVPQPTPAGLAARLAGDYRLAGMAVRLEAVDGQLRLLAEGDEPRLLHYDSAGDFHPEGVDARLEVGGGHQGRPALVWHQAGMRLPLRPEGQPALDLAAYAGNYPLQPGFVIGVDEEDGQLRARATGQGAFLLAHQEGDVFVAPEFGIRLEFRRGPDGRVHSLVLEQGGTRRQAPRQ